MEFLLGLLPVCAFLAGLFLLDSYKLVPPTSLLVSLAAGCGAALVSYPVNLGLMHATGLGFTPFSRYVAPLTEESLKSAFLIYLLLTRRTGFLVDTAIHGFAIGAGFALVENIAYFVALERSTALLWIIRGFGTATMHGAVTAIAGIIAKVVADRASSAGWTAVLPGVALAVILHSAFNHFFLPAVASTLLIVLAFPLLMSAVFRRSGQATRRWLGVGFDTDRELLEMITSGRLAETRIGAYLLSLESRFRGEVLADMLCVLRLHLELSIAAKGLLLMHAAGFDVPPDPEWKEKFAETTYLQKTIGRTGMLAVLPFLHTGRGQLREILRV